jgi:uncharacterized protein YeeX (DUF496 family)
VTVIAAGASTNARRKYGKTLYRIIQTVINIMNIQEYNQKMLTLIIETCELSEQQEAIQKRVDEIEEAATRLRFEYMTIGDVL